MDTALIKNIIFEKKYVLLRHILFWVAYLFVFTIIDFSYDKKRLLSFIVAFEFIPEHILYTYIILYWLMPKFLLKARYDIFFISYSILAFCGMFFHFFYRYYIALPFRTGIVEAPLSIGLVFKHFDGLFSFVVLNTVALFAVFIKMFKYWYVEQYQKTAMEKAKLSIELEVLKAQLHPHFLFNTLNNLYSLVYEKSEKAPQMLLQLAGLLSYVLYECKANEVLLTKEIDFIKNYIALEQQRYGDRLDVSLHFSGIGSDVNIKPLLFQPFIENAFKHGASEKIDASWMSVEISVLNNQLSFKMINSIDATRKIENEASGIGIDNLQKRLVLLYPMQHTLSFGYEDDLYIVSLMVSLNGKQSLTPTK